MMLICVISTVHNHRVNGMLMSYYVYCFSETEYVYAVIFISVILFLLVIALLISCDIYRLKRLNRLVMIFNHNC